MKTEINKLLQRQMDRKDFLKHVGIGLVMLVGGGSVLKLLKPQQFNAGYGSSAYGGSTDVLKR